MTRPVAPVTSPVDGPGLVAAGLLRSAVLSLGLLVLLSGLTRIAAGDDSLGEAVGSPLLVFRTGGHSGWFPETNAAVQGLSSARSGAITNNQQSWIETRLTGPGRLRFSWKASSETNWDVLRFSCDQQDLFRISGETSWQEVEAYIEAGEHVVNWDFTKDESRSRGLDAAWLDGVVWTPGECAPIIDDTVPLPTLRIPTGTRVVLSLLVMGTPPIRLLWQKDGAALVDDARVSGANSGLLAITNLMVSDSGVYVLRASNPKGVTLSRSVTLAVFEAPPLSGIFGASQLPWDSGGAAPWYGQPLVSLSGISAQSGSIKDGEESWLETRVTGPGELRFQWKVSSENGYDFLSLAMDGRSVAQISGESAWAPRSVVIPAGTHQVRWTYRKDEGDFNATGSDAGWLDEVIYVPQLAPRISTQPVTVAAGLGGSATLSAEVMGELPLAYEWRRGDTAAAALAAGGIEGAIGPSLMLTNLQPADASFYLLVVTNAHGSATSDAVQVLVTVPVAEALSDSGLKWTTGSAVPWLGLVGDYAGVDRVARSGVVADSRESWLETSATGPGVLQFRWKVSSEEAYDFLSLLVDGVVLASVSGEVDWESRRFFLQPGTHKVRWRYKKDQTDGVGLDAGWLGSVTFTPGDVAPFVLSQTADLELPEGATARLDCAVAGSGPLGLQWLKGQLPLVAANRSGLVLTNLHLNDSGEYRMVASNFLGTISSHPIRLNVFATTPLSEALGGAVLAWTTGGDAAWFGRTNVGFDGRAAAESGRIGDGAETWLQAQVLGPGILSFRWKVSSELSYDGVSLTLDGVSQDQISGQSGWVYRSIRVPEGVHAVRWTYSKDHTLGTAADRAWVDTVEFWASRTFATWVGSMFNAADQARPEVSGPSADPDGDGNPNLVEFLTGSDPRVAGAGSPIRAWVEIDAQDHSVRRLLGILWHKSAAGVTTEFQASPDLVGWSPCVLVPTDVLDVGGGTELRVFRESDNPAGQARFFRLLVK